MNYSMVLYILGYILKFESAFLMLPALVSLIYQEKGRHSVCHYRCNLSGFRDCFHT